MFGKIFNYKEKSMKTGVCVCAHCVFSFIIIIVYRTLSFRMNILGLVDERTWYNICSFFIIVFILAHKLQLFFSSLLSLLDSLNLPFFHKPTIIQAYTLYRWARDKSWNIRNSHALEIKFAKHVYPWGPDTVYAGIFICVQHCVYINFSFFFFHRVSEVFVLSAIIEFYSSTRLKILNTSFTLDSQYV